MQLVLLRCSDELRSLASEQPTAPSAGPSDYLIADEPLPARRTRVSPADTGDWARIAYDNRRLRDKIFDDPDLFADPAWDILLDLTRWESAGKRLQTTSVCIASCVPPTTALRWIMVLEERGLVRREVDLLDQRRTFIRLTGKGRNVMRDYFAELGRRKDGATLFFRD